MPQSPRPWSSFPPPHPQPGGPPASASARSPGSPPGADPGAAEGYAPKIWRCPEADFYGDEPMDALEVYTPQVLEAIGREGFDAIWLRGRLGRLFTSAIFPQLNDPDADRRIDHLAALIERAHRRGLGVYLFFNEPLAIPRGHRFWADHPSCRGQPYHDPVEDEHLRALCTSTPRVRAYMSEGIGRVFQRLPGLGGVVLITATELHTHCWSHHILRGLDDGFTHRATEELACPRCRGREPAEVVAELVTLWRDAAAGVQPRPRVIVWNWSWSIWYPDPQAPVIDRLPEGVELLADWERGGVITRRGREVPLDEYSLGYVGPGDRFRGARRLAGERGLAMHAKLQVGTTHELATVPNLPAMGNLHAKLVGLGRQRVEGVMATWNFGCALTLNSFAFGLFMGDPSRYARRDRFFADLAEQYFGIPDPAPLARAWDRFAQALEHYPFSIRFLYTSPLNYAPAYPLLPTYEDRPLGPSWQEHAWGDRLETCLGPFTLDQAIDAFNRMADLWDRGLASYVRALEAGAGVGSPAAPDLAVHRREERSCAMMIGVQLRSMAHLLAFHRWRRAAIGEHNRTPPCAVALDQAGARIIRRELDNAARALELARADPRLGYHQEPRAYLYTPEGIRAKMKRMRAALTQAGPGL